MSRPTSLFLDLLRLLASGSVFGYHCMLVWYPAWVSGGVETAGHRAVIIFFVLSGYVIAFSTLRKPTSAQNYAAARLSRLYSVVVPAVVLTAVLQAMGTRLNPALYASVERGHDLLRYLLTSVFLQSVWTTNTAPPTNGPFWSLGYEFWYYAIFGAAVFIRPLAGKVMGVLALIAISGIDPLLLMPSWLFGAALYLYGRRLKISPRAASVATVLAVTTCIAAFFCLPNWPQKYGYPPFFFSSAFITDGLIGLLLAAVIGCVDQAFRHANVNERFDAVIRWLADHTFSLYLYHFPIILFVAAVLPFDRTNPLQVCGVIGMILAIILVLSLVTESTRGSWRRFFKRALDRWFGAVPSQPRSVG